MWIRAVWSLSPFVRWAFVYWTGIPGVAMVAIYPPLVPCETMMPLLSISVWTPAPGFVINFDPFVLIPIVLLFPDRVLSWTDSEAWPVRVIWTMCRLLVPSMVMLAKQRPRTLVVPPLLWVRFSIFVCGIFMLLFELDLWKPNLPAIGLGATRLGTLVGGGEPLLLPWQTRVVCVWTDGIRVHRHPFG